MIQKLVSTKNGNFTHLSSNGKKTLCGREAAEAAEGKYVSCHRCTRAMNSETSRWINS